MKKKNGKGQEQAFHQKKVCPNGQETYENMINFTSNLRNTSKNHSDTPLHAHLHVCAQSLQSCLTLCDPMDHRPPGSSVRGILQARILDSVASPSSGDLPNPAVISASLTSLALADRIFTTSATWEAHVLTGKVRSGNARSDLR